MKQLIFGNLGGKIDIAKAEFRDAEESQSKDDAMCHLRHIILWLNWAIEEAKIIQNIIENGNTNELF